MKSSLNTSVPWNSSWVRPLEHFVWLEFFRLGQNIRNLFFVLLLKLILEKWKKILIFKFDFPLYLVWLSINWPQIINRHWQSVLDAKLLKLSDRISGRSVLGFFDRLQRIVAVRLGKAGLASCGRRGWNLIGKCKNFDVTSLYRTSNKGQENESNFYLKEWYNSAKELRSFIHISWTLKWCWSDRQKITKTLMYQFHKSQYQFFGKA